RRVRAREEVVGSGAARGRAPRLADETAELGGRDELPEARARRGGDGLVGERAPHVVGARGEEVLRHFRSFLDPRRLDVAEAEAAKVPGESLHLDRLDAGGALARAGHAPAAA